MYYVIIALIAIFVTLGTTYLIKNDSIESTDESGRAESNESTIDPVTPPQNVASKTGTVDLHGQDITQVPASVFERTDIEVLDLSNNALEGALQAEVRLLTNLHTLDLSDNKFTGVPAEVGQLTNLEVLNLSNNPITGLPQEIGNLKNLRILDLRSTNYAVQDFEVIKQGLSSNVEIRID